MKTGPSPANARTTLRPGLLPAALPAAVLLAGLLLAGFPGAAASAERASDPAPAPNVVFILADDLGIVDINAYAQRFTGADPSEMFFETPNLDRLQREGLSFSQAYATHLCSPTRASLLTGKYAARVGFTTAVGGNVKTFLNQGLEPPEGYLAQDALEWRDRITIEQALLNGTTRDALASGHPLDQGQDEVTLAEAMPGHEAFFLGKWHVGGHGSDGWQPRDQGFTELGHHDEGASRYFSWRGAWNRRAPRASTPTAALERATPKSGTPRPPALSVADHGQPYLTDELTERAVDFLHQRVRPGSGAQKPFFLYLCHFAVHTPFQAKPEDIAHFESKPTRGWNRHENATYAAMLRSLDASVGRILDALAETGLEDNTLVVFMSDNGGVTYTTPLATWNAPFKGGKATHFEGGIRVPLVLRWPGRINGGVWSDVAVDSNDLFPTVLELAGYDPAPHIGPEGAGGIDGRSLAPLLDDPQNTTGGYPRDTFFWHYPLNVIVKSPEDGLPSAPSSAIRRGRWKLIHDWSGAARLYDLATDPFEHTDLSNENPDLTLSLFRELHDWIDANVEKKYTPAINPDYDPANEARDRPFVDLRAKWLGRPRAIRTVEDDPRFELLERE